MKNYLNKTSFLSHERPKTGIDFMIFILICLENCQQYYAILSCSVWLRTGCYPADINRFRSHTGKNYQLTSIDFNF